MVVRCGSGGWSVVCGRPWGVGSHGLCACMLLVCFEVKDCPYKDKPALQSKLKASKQAAVRRLQQRSVGPQMSALQDDMAAGRARSDDRRFRLLRTGQAYDRYAWDYTRMRIVQGGNTGPADHMLPKLPHDGVVFRRVFRTPPKVAQAAAAAGVTPPAVQQGAVDAKPRRLSLSQQSSFPTSSDHGGVGAVGDGAVGDGDDVVQSSQLSYSNGHGRNDRGCGRDRCVRLIATRGAALPAPSIEKSRGTHPLTT